MNVNAAAPIGGFTLFFRSGVTFSPFFEGFWVIFRQLPVLNL